MNLEDLPLEGQKALVRVDFNVPLDNEGKITDDTRIRAALPTIQYILDRGGGVILMSHLGRPKGEKNPKYSLEPVRDELEKLLGKEVQLVDDCVGRHVEKVASKLQPGEILLLENLRFHKAEEDPQSDPTFAKNLAKLGDVYINDAFGTAHRKHSSTAVIAKYFDGLVAPGLLMQKEIDFLKKHLESPQHPFYAIIGGSKISSKLGVLKSLLNKVDALFIGGGMVYTFLKSLGIEIGESIVEKDLIPEAKQFLEEAKSKNIPVYFPKDQVIANAFSNDAEKKIVYTEKGIPNGWRGMDIGPITRTEWANTLKNAKMIFWNGPLGVFEMPQFSEGTHDIASTLAHLDAITIAGGGDSVAAINELGLLEKFSHISTGGGATLEFIEKGHLPGIDAITT